MQSSLGHVVFSVNPANLPFYRDLLSFLGWQTYLDSPEMLGMGDAKGASVWFGAATKDVANDYDGPGVNHVAIGTETQADVDATVAYLQERGVPALFETPRHRPEFGMGEGQTYYQVMFETPDRLLFEVVYQGPKS